MQFIPNFGQFVHFGHTVVVWSGMDISLNQGFHQESFESEGRNEINQERSKESFISLNFLIECLV
jgi:hypothetical protein